jgi:hypothetical protein
MRTVRFYTKQEEKRMLEVYKSCNSQVEAARLLSKELKRDSGNIQVKISSLLRKNNSPKKNIEEKGITIPAGFNFDIQPKRAVMYTDHVRLYF